MNILRRFVASHFILLASVFMVAAARPALAQRASLSNSSRSFGSVAVGSTSAPKSVTVSNGSSVALSVGSITVAGDFAQTNTCGSSVAGAGKLHDFHYVHPNSRRIADRYSHHYRQREQQSAEDHAQWHRCCARFDDARLRVLTPPRTLDPPPPRRASRLPIISRVHWRFRASSQPEISSRPIVAVRRFRRKPHALLM